MTATTPRLRRENLTPEAREAFESALTAIRNLNHWPTASAWDAVERAVELAFAGGHLQGVNDFAAEALDMIDRMAPEFRR